MMLKSLLHSLYDSFDKDSHIAVGLRVSHADGFVWAVSGRVLTASTETGAPIGTYTLVDYSLLTLAYALHEAGCTIIYQNPEYQNLSAAIVMSGAGQESVTNGDHLWVYTSLLWVVLDAFALELERVQVQIPNAIREIDYYDSDSQFTDYWSNWWGIPRILGESDLAFKDRTIYEITRPKNNPYCMEVTLKHMFGEYFRIREPWKEVMYLSDGGLMDEDKHYQGLEWIYHDAQVVGWSRNLLNAHAVANKDRPAGTILLDPWPKYPGAQIYYPDGGGIAWEEWLLGYYANIGLQGILSENLSMSDYIMDFGVKIAIGELLTYANEEGLNLYSYFYKHLFCKGEIILSDSDPLETLQAHFGGRMKVCNGSHQIMSDFAGLSDGNFEWHYEPIDVWIDDDRHFGLFELPIDRSVVNGTEEVYGADVKIARGAKWTGRWDSRHWQDGVFVGMRMS